MEKATTRIALPYGDATVEVELPTRNLLAVAGPRDVEVPADATALLQQAFRKPIGMPPFSTLLSGGEHVVLLVDDNTRPTPADQILPVLLEELQVRRKGVFVTVLIALGTHRKMTPEEIERKVGPEIVAAYPVLCHEWEEESALVDLGHTPNGTPIKINRLAHEADMCLGIGNIVPHNIAGWSGGAKIVQPGICGKEATYATHLLAARCPSSNLGSVSNPVRAEIDAVAKHAKLAGIVNTVLDRHGTVVSVVAGKTQEAFVRGVEVARTVWEVPVPGLADIVVVSSHPADIDFWQANKGLYAAERVVKRGGDIVLLTPCPDGLSGQREHVETLEMLEGIPSRMLFHEAQRRGIHDYAALALSVVCARCNELAWVTVVSDCLSDGQLQVLGHVRAVSVDEALSRAFARQGRDASVVVLTHGGEMLPIVQP